MRFLSKGILTVLILLPACTFEDGLPWGKATFEVSSGFSAAGRESAGRLKTSKDYEIQLDSFKLNLVSVSLNTATEGVASTFDPAAPPPGYSLCHNGHCHASDGRLVDYEDIQADLAGVGASGDAILQAIDELVDVTQNKNAVLGPCSDDCELGRGFLRTVDLRVSSVEVIGKVFDTRPESRLPPGGVELRGLVPIDALFSQAVNGSVEGAEPPGIEVAVEILMTAPVFDVLDFASLQVDGVVDLSKHIQIHEQFNEHLKHTALFNVNVKRFNL